MLKSPKIKTPQRAVIAALLCLVVALAWIGKSLQISHTNYATQLNQCEDGNCPREKAITPIAPNTNDQRGNGDRNWYREFLKPTDWLLVIFTFLLALYTKRLNTATGELKRSTDKLWEAGERHSERELRAFVFAKAIGITPNTVTKAYTSSHGTYEEPVSWVISVIWENAGSTRTKNMFTHVSSDFFDGEMPDNFDFPDLGDHTRVPTMIGPHAIILSSGFEFKVGDPRVAAVSAGKKHLYIWGWAEYDDIFDGTSRHRTEFCYELFFIGAFPVKAQLVHRIHRLHNAADEECRHPLKTPRAA